jgi:signal transduction histidine kinase
MQKHHAAPRRTLLAALHMGALLGLALLCLGSAAAGLAARLFDAASAPGPGLPAGLALLGCLCLARAWHLGWAQHSGPVNVPAAAQVHTDEHPGAAPPGLATLAPRLARLTDALPGRALLVGRETADSPWLLLHGHDGVADAASARRLRHPGPPYPELAHWLASRPDWHSSAILAALPGHAPTRLPLDAHEPVATEAPPGATPSQSPTPAAASAAADAQRPTAALQVLPLDLRTAVVWLAPSLPQASPSTSARHADTDGPARPADTESESERESFLYTVSHDLRAPIRVIEGFTRILKEDYGTGLDRIGNDHLDRVLGAAARMTAMIDAMLGLSRLTTRALQLECVDLTALADQVMDELRRQAPGRQAEITIQPGMTAQGDPTLLRNVLDNLLGNAWKYSARRDVTRIEFSAASPAHGYCVFRLSDNGAGFDMRFAERLFAPFQRLHSASAFAGTGVGLASVRRIVRRHGGDIWAEAEVDRGATFCFTLASAPAA